MRLPGALAGALIIVAASVLAGGCGGKEESGVGGLRVGYAFGNDAGDIGDMVAYERLREQGVSVTVSDTGGPENAVAALRRTSIDLAAVTQASMLQAISQGADLVALVGQNMVPEWQLVARGTDSVRGLAGKQVGVSEGSSGTSTVFRAERAAGLEPGSIRLRVIPESTARAVALANGRLDAAVLDGSDVILLQRELPDLRVLSRLADSGALVAPMVFVATRDFVEKNGALLERFVTALLETSEALNGDDGREAFVRAGLAGALEGESADLAGAIYDYYRSAGLWPRASAPITREQYERTTAFLRETGQLESTVPFDRAWDLAYWRKNG